jgi:hypothetical protein
MRRKLNLKQTALHFGVEPRIVLDWVARGLLMAESAAPRCFHFRIEEISRFEISAFGQREIPKQETAQIMLNLGFPVMR